jgi:hypothetical protein
MKRPALGLAAVALAMSVGLTHSASAAGDTVTVPKAGPKTVGLKWTGKYTAGLNWTSLDCNGVPDSLRTAHPFTVKVPSGAYNLVRAKMMVTVESSPTLNGDFMELVDPAGNSAGIDMQASTMEVDVINPRPGQWTVLTCEFLPDSVGDHPYTGRVTIKTTCKAASPCPRKR